MAASHLKGTIFLKKLIIGILAHVDAGKTTLTEAMLFKAGQLRRLGRVDHRDAFLDTDTLERERGITIFSSQAILPLPEVELTLVDTPGHVDFSPEMERTLQILDYAILVISGTDGVQSHTRTLWKLLARYEIPTFLFVNKMDLAGADREARMAELRTLLSGSCVDVSAPGWEEDAALCGESLLETYLQTGTLTPAQAAPAAAARQLFPCWFGSALKLEGVDALLEGLAAFTVQPVWPAEFGARVYKITRDAQGTRLTWLKVTGGSLHVRDTLQGPDWAEKATQLRLYSGEKFQQTDAVPAGGVCAAVGLSRTWSGQSLGADPAAQAPLLEPVMSCRILLPQETDTLTALQQLRQLEEESPQLHLVWNEAQQQLSMLSMGDVQLEVLQRRILDRFDLAVSFGPAAVAYRETIAAPVEGVGHYEPLRHYAEVHLLLEPAARGSGLQFASACSTDVLDRNWQRLILSHLEEKTHLGVLTGSPITDMKITLLTGRAHLAHTEGGDFRQATWRAVRQGLMEAESVLLEPYYSFTLEVPADCVGRAMSDLQQRGAEYEGPELTGDMALLTGSGPVSVLQDYPAELRAYSRGRGRLYTTVQGYAPCHNAQEVIDAAAYDPEADLASTPDSVFCSHGAGHTVKWNEVKQYMHLEAAFRPAVPASEPAETLQPQAAPAGGGHSTNRPLTRAEEKELEALFERTHGPVRQPQVRQAPKKPARHDLDDSPVTLPAQETRTEYLLVDGYNIIFAWEELAQAAAVDLENARRQLMDRMCSYQGCTGCTLILVFDAYRVKGHHRTVEPYHNITVVYTKEAETADMYIERTSHEIAGKHRVRVATSDNLEQLIVLSHGCLRLSARAFHAEVEAAEQAAREAAVRGR